MMAIHLAIIANSSPANRLSVVTRLIANGADVNARASPHQETPLHFAAAEDGLLKVVSLLLEAGADVHSRDVHGQTPLRYAVWEPYVVNEECLALLIQAGADVNSTSNNESTPLHAAAYYGHFTACKLLLRAGADTTGFIKRLPGDHPVVYTSAGLTPLLSAIRDQESVHRSVLCVRALLKAGASPNVAAQDSGGESPLQSALSISRPHLAAVLVSYGAELALPPGEQRNSLALKALAMATKRMALLEPEDRLCGAPDGCPFENLRLLAEQVSYQEDVSERLDLSEIETRDEPEDFASWDMESEDAAQRAEAASRFRAVALLALAEASQRTMALLEQRSGMHGRAREKLTYAAVFCVARLANIKETSLLALSMETEAWDELTRQQDRVRAVCSHLKALVAAA